MKKLIKKLASQSGESIVESLCAILIIALTFAFLCESIVTATRINKAAEAVNTEFVYQGQAQAHKNASGGNERITISAVRDLASAGNDGSILNPNATTGGNEYKPRATLYVDRTGTFYHYDP